MVDVWVLYVKPEGLEGKVTLHPGTGTREQKSVKEKEALSSRSTELREGGEVADGGQQPLPGSSLVWGA